MNPDRERPQGPSGVPPFHVHPGHLFEGFELIEREGQPALLLARCSCGEVLDTAQARFVRCPDCDGGGGECARCRGSGTAIDHAALEWTLP